MRRAIGMLLMALAVAGCGPSSSKPEETYRLVHAIGNTERISARDLPKDECERRRDEMKATASTMGIGGSITCLPESFFSD